jgi:uncharacterized radical SAM superfamily Fe-S cluster-containing enzyme
MNIMDFIRLFIIETNTKQIKKTHILPNGINESLIEIIMSFFEKYNSTKSVKDVFIEIKKQLKEEKISPEDSIMIEKILEIIYLSSIINYNQYLYYIIPQINS